MMKAIRRAGLGLVLATATTVFANPPSDAQIIQWINNISASNADPARSIKIENTQEVVLYSGEKAFVSGVYFNNSGRNFWGGYILTRPKLRQAKILPELGGQSNTFRVHPIYLSGKDRGIDLIEFESAGSGQGVIEAAKTIGYIQDWTVKTVYEVFEGSDIGRYDESIEDSDCKTGSDVHAYLNVIDYGRYIVETKVESDACENKQTQDYKISNQLIPVRIP